jgi:hypothetical protein
MPIKLYVPISAGVPTDIRSSRQLRKYCLGTSGKLLSSVSKTLRLHWFERNMSVKQHTMYDSVLCKTCQVLILDAMWKYVISDKLCYY